MPVSRGASGPQLIILTGRVAPGDSPDMEPEEELLMPQNIPRPPRPGISAVRRLHRRYHGVPMSIYVNQLRRRRDMGIFKRPTTGDRMDLAGERRWWRGMSEADQVMEKAQGAQYERDAAIGRRLWEDSQPYQGSRLEAERRAPGRHRKS